MFFENHKVLSNSSCQRGKKSLLYSALILSRDTKVITTKQFILSSSNIGSCCLSFNRSLLSIAIGQEVPTCKSLTAKNLKVTKIAFDLV